MSEFEIKTHGYMQNEKEKLLAFEREDAMRAERDEARAERDEVIKRAEVVERELDRIDAFLFGNQLNYSPDRALSIGTIVNLAKRSTESRDALASQVAKLEGELAEAKNRIVECKEERCEMLSDPHGAANLYLAQRDEARHQAQSLAGQVGALRMRLESANAKLLLSMQNHGCDPCGITEELERIRAAIDTAASGEGK